MNRHRVMVVPSIWEEPFGIVALEGLACGCEVVIARSGGLPEATGPFGVTFKRGDPVDLANVINFVLTHKIQADKVAVRAHLRNFTVESTTTELLKVLTQQCRFMNSRG